MSLEGLAGRSGLTKGTIYTIETSADPNPTLKTMMALADGLDVAPLTFFANRPTFPDADARRQDHWEERAHEGA